MFSKKSNDDDNISQRSTIKLILFLFPSLSWADLPLSVEDLLSEKGKVRSEVSVIYANSAQWGVDVANSILLQTSPNTTIALPTQIGERLSNTDALVTNAGLRYGLSKNSEIYGRASAIQTNRRFDNLQGNHTTSDSQFADAWVGLNYRFRNDIDRAAWIGFAELQLAEKPIDANTTYGKSAVFGFTTYQTYDPVVLSLTASTQLNAKRTIDGVDYRPGHSAAIAPSVGFAVNDKVTLSTGLRWQMKQADDQNGVSQGIRKTSTSLDFGLGYALTKADTLNLSARPNVSGEGDVQVTLNWVHRFGDVSNLDK